MAGVGDVDVGVRDGVTGVVCFNGGTANFDDVVGISVFGVVEATSGSTDDGED
jgi:hypothetical protein